jgi:hypothetical protein
MSKKKLPPPGGSGRTKRVADEGEPVVVVPLVVEPVVVGLALRAVPPHVHDVLLALERIVLNTIHVTIR